NLIKSQISERAPSIPDFILNTDENLELTLNKEESMNLIKKLKRGPNEKAQKFSKNAIEFYKKNENKRRDL
ncbi:MAG: hypothetical protein ACFFD2_28870, partial [Promethearchaeota archaeon]